MAKNNKLREKLMADLQKAQQDKQNIVRQGVMVDGVILYLQTEISKLQEDSS